jgi:hypothetical protein
MANRIRSMGTATMKFNEGLIISGSAAQPDGTSSDYAVIVSGSQFIDAAGGGHGLSIFKEESDSAFIRFINSDDPSSWYAYIAFDIAENMYIAPGRSQDFYLQTRTGVGSDPITFPFRIYDNGKAKFAHGELGPTAATDLAGDVIFSVSGSLDGTRNAVFGGNVQVSGSLNVDQQLSTKAIAVKVRDVNSTSSVQAADYILRCIQNSSITITLPSKNISSGRVLVFKDTLGNAGSPNNNTITIDGDSNDTIDGSATYVVNSNKESITLICDGINGWMITSRFVT